MARQVQPPPPDVPRDCVAITIYPFGHQRGWPAWIERGKLVCACCEVPQNCPIEIVEPPLDSPRREYYATAVRCMNKQGYTCVTNIS